MLLLHAGGAIASADEQGNNGTVKIHEGATETEPMRANEPHVCTFHVHGFNFDAGSSGTWSITGQAPGGSSSATDRPWTADSSGEWRTAVQAQFTPGHYKLSAKQTTPATSGGEKHKVFWVDCGQGTTGNNGNNGNNVATPTPTPNQQGNGGGQGNTGNQPASLTGTGSRSKGGTRTGTGSKSKGAGSATGTGSQSKQNVSNGASATGAGSVASNNGGTDNTASVSEHGETPGAGGNAGGNAGAGGSAAGGAQGNINVPGTQANVNVPGMQSNVSAPGAQGNISLPSTQGNSNVAGGTSASVNNLPSTSTDESQTAPLTLLGTILMALGAFLLKRPGRITR
jgi:hypothetical protein